MTFVRTPRLFRKFRDRSAISAPNPKPTPRRVRAVVAIATAVGLCSGLVVTAHAATTGSSAPSRSLGLSASSSASSMGSQCFSFENARYKLRIAFRVSVNKDRGSLTRDAIVDVWAATSDPTSKYRNYTLVFHPLNDAHRVDLRATHTEDSGHYFLFTKSWSTKNGNSRIALGSGGGWPDPLPIVNRRGGFYVPGVLMAYPGSTAAKRGAKVVKVSDFSIRPIVRYDGDDITGVLLEAVYPDRFFTKRSYDKTDRTVSHWKLMSTGDSGFYPGAPWCR